MKIVIAYPPNIEEIDKVFNVKNTKGIVYTYGDILFNPDDAYVDIALMVHEETHTSQQGNDPKGWWDRYIADVDFRLSQEIEAYSNQYEKFCEIVKDKNTRFKFLRKIAGDLSSPMYGNIINVNEAMKAIKNK